MHLLITGKRNIGKSTLIKKALNQSEVSFAGFVTLPHNDLGVLDAFFIEPASNDSADLYPEWASRQIGIPGQENWKAFPETFDSFGVKYIKEALESDRKVILMDELGFFENDAYEFQDTVLACLDQTKKPVIAVVKAVDTVFLNKVRSHANTTLLTVDLDNRDQLLFDVVQWLSNLEDDHENT